MTGAAAYPLNTLYVYLTEGCNLACRHCWLAPQYDPQLKKTAVLPVELFEKAVREAKPLGLRSVKLTGGEPLLHPEFLTLLGILRREGLGLVVETNGLLCTPELAQEIAQFPSRFVSVSLDGADAETHERVRGVKGAFALATRAVINLAGAGVETQVIFSVMKSNAHQVEDIIALAEQLGAGSVKFNIIQPTARGEKLHADEQALSVADYIQIGRRVENELAPRAKLQLYYDYPAAFRPLSRLAEHNGVCGIHGILGLLPDGHYALCGIGAHIPDLVFGDARRDALEDVWTRHPTLQSLREGIPARLEGACARCLMKNRCLGSCAAQNYYRSGSLLAPFWFCEEAKRAGLFPASRLS